MMKVVGIIPARGGSKGIPRKNLALLNGKPLLQYTAEAALGAHSLSRTILSTEDPEIAETGRALGLDVPFLRPEHLSKDSTPTLPVVQHALGWLEDKGERFDAICLLQPTSPMRTSADIDACIDLLECSGADTVITVLQVPPEYNPHWVYFQQEGGSLVLSTGEPAPIPRRQELPPAFHREGSVYLTRRRVLFERSTLYGERTVGYLIDSSRSVNIDDPEDLVRAGVLLAARDAAGETDSRCPEAAATETPATVIAKGANPGKVSGTQTDKNTNRFEMTLPLKHGYSFLE